MLICVTFPGFDPTGYDWLYTAGAWPHQVQFTLPGHPLTHLGFPECRAVLSVTFIPDFCHVYGLMIFD